MVLKIVYLLEYNGTVVPAAPCPRLSGQCSAGVCRLLAARRQQETRGGPGQDKEQQQQVRGPHRGVAHLGNRTLGDHQGQTRPGQETRAATRDTKEFARG